MSSIIRGLALYCICVCLFGYSVCAVCPDGFEHHGDDCYKVSALEASWIEAKYYCRVLGAELLIVNSAAEESTVEGILARLHGSHIDEDYWISGSDIITEKTWRWMTDDGQSVPIGYTNWMPGRPDNSGGQENCLTIHYHGSRTAWNDQNCKNQHSFICEIGYDGSINAIDIGTEVVIG